MKYRFIGACTLALIVPVGAAVAAAATPRTQYPFATKWEVAAPNAIAVDGVGYVHVASGGLAGRASRCKSGR
ncbi:MAG: hypothetical protein GXY82_11020 [Methanospirillum sp.]|nr:hypothetical protein [Methanospirillum sp.]